MCAREYPTNRPGAARPHAIASWKDSTIRAGLRATLVACGVFLGSCAVAADVPGLGEVDYQLGHGMHIPGLGLTLGGYATCTYENLRSSPGRFTVEDASLSVWWDGPFGLRAFSEFDYEKPVGPRSDGTQGHRQGEGSDGGRYLAIERIYVDYALTETTTVRIGKFLTPIGRWNQLHAAPLVWTTSRPLVTTRAFPTNVTALMVSSAVFVAGRSVDVSVYATRGAEVRPDSAIDPFSEAIGGRVVVPVARDLQAGVSYVSFEQARTGDERKSLVGADVQWTHARYQVSVEALYRFSSRGSQRDERGAFIQFVAPLGERLYAVARYEHYRAVDPRESINTGVLGLNLRLTPAIVLKAEGARSSRNSIGAPTGFLSSISVLF